jgi:hypothetical protein
MCCRHPPRQDRVSHFERSLVFGREYAHVLEWRQDWLGRGEWDTPTQSRFSILVERLPPELRSDTALRSYFERLFPGKVHSAVVCLDRQVLCELETLCEARSIDQERKRRQEKRKKEPPPTVAPAPSTTAAAATSRRRRRRVVVSSTVGVARGCEASLPPPSSLTSLTSLALRARLCHG